MNSAWQPVPEPAQFFAVLACSTITLSIIQKQVAKVEILNEHKIIYYANFV